MNDDLITAIFTIIVFILIILLIIFLLIERYNDGYKQGQVDAINGNIKIKLVEFKDGTRKYYKESELKDLVEHKIINQ